MAKVYTFNTALHHTLRFLVTPWFRKHYPYHLSNPEILKEMKPPYVLLPNHMMKWDVALIGIIIKDPIHYMASDTHFRSKSTRFFMKKLGTFPKSKAKSDLKAIKHMMSLKEQSKIICIYPEGQMTWDGKTMPLFYSTAKLLKLLKLPVYVPISKGSYGVEPRWAKARRKGEIEYTIYPLNRDGKSFKQMSVDEIYEKMNSILKRDEYKTIEDNKWNYSSDSLAEYLENFLFICPECHNITSMHSKGDIFYCKECGFTQKLTHRYHFQAVKGGLSPFETPADWSEWQREKLKDLLDSYRKEDSHVPFMEDKQLEIKTGHRQDPTRTLTKKGEMALYSDYILLKIEKGEIQKLPLDEINGIHVMTRHKLEFYHKRTLYMIDFPDIRTSGYKWLCALRLLGLPSSYAWSGEEVERN